MAVKEQKRARTVIRDEIENIRRMYVYAPQNCETTMEDETIEMLH